MLSEDRLSGPAGTNRLQVMMHSHHAELPQLSRFRWCFPDLWRFSLQPDEQPLLPEAVATDSARVSTCTMARQAVQALVIDLQSKSRWGFQLGLALLQNRVYGTTEGQAG